MDLRKTIKVAHKQLQERGIEHALIGGTALVRPGITGQGRYRPSSQEIF